MGPRHRGWRKRRWSTVLARILAEGSAEQQGWKSLEEMGTWQG